MELIRADTHIDFIGKRKFALIISSIVILISLGSIVLHGGLNYGVDFAGGILLQIRFSKSVDISQVRSGLEAMGQKDVSVQKFGGENEFLIRIEKSAGDLETMSKRFQLLFDSNSRNESLEIRRVEVVGPKVGKDLKTRALWAVGLSFAAILVYVAFRFHTISYGLGGIVALVHDVMVTYGALSVFQY